VDKASLELLLAQGASIEKIARRFGKDPATIAYWVRKHELESPYRKKHASRGGIERARLEALVERGATIAEIATEVEFSKATVRYWLRRYGLRTKNGRGPKASEARSAKVAGLLITTLVQPSRRDKVLAGGTGLLPVHEVSLGRGFAAPSEGQGDPGPRGRRVLRDLRVRPLLRRA
jgi:transposase-like protein